MVTRLSANRPRLLAAAFEARERAINALQFENEDRDDGGSHRIDLLEFASFCLLTELHGHRLAVEPYRDSFAMGLAILDHKYRHPVLCRTLLALAREGAPLG
jgi:hypothetical protein